MDARPTEHGNPALPAQRIPGAFAIAWRAALVALLTAWATIASQTVRGLVGGFGLGVRDVLVVSAATFVAMLAVLPLAAVIDFPQAIFGHWMPERRWRRGDCPACGYEAGGGRCPECGAEFQRPLPYASSWATLRRAAWMIVPAWCIGLAAGLFLVHQDEAAFRTEAEAARARTPGMASVQRRRAWPADFAELSWSPRDGFVGRPPFEATKFSPEAGFRPGAATNSDREARPASERSASE